MALVSVVYSAHGTAKGISQNISYHIAGKTGPAQVLGIKQNAKYNENDIDFKFRDHALFISFAPADDPKIAVAVIVENGGHGGSVAAPIAGQVIKQFLGDNNENRNPQASNFTAFYCSAAFSAKLHIDIPLFIALFLTSLLSFAILYSAGSQTMDISRMRQAARMGLAFLFMTVLAHIAPYQFKRYSALLFGLGIFLLIAVLIMGQIGKGAQRWLDLRFLGFQPSEMIKITTPMMIAWYLAEHPLPPKSRQLLIATVLIIIPTLLIAKQPDLGTALLVASSGAGVLFFAGLSWRFLLAIFAVLASLTPIIWHFMRDYQRDRVHTFLNPESDPLGRGYHIIQSKIAIGSGGIYGKGWLGSTQSELDFLPESSTDFIFAVLLKNSVYSAV